ncbi:MAG: hypothetical protein KatS3mg082_1361 [Nitrospiraceae bacterium]|nr:MAG: hypothetical protein KatS3mg082_1361 [Nitrospiraceae bacterium]
MADHGGNITDMNTRVIGSEDRPVYVMILEIQLLEGARPDALEQALERLKPTLGVESDVPSDRTGAAVAVAVRPILL